MPHEVLASSESWLDPKVHPNGLTMCPVDKPTDEPIHVNTDRVTRCPVKLPDTCWLGLKRSCKSCKKQRTMCLILGI